MPQKDIGESTFLGGNINENKTNIGAFFIAMACL